MGSILRQVPEDKGLTNNIKIRRRREEKGGKSMAPHNSPHNGVPMLYWLKQLRNTIKFFGNKTIILIS